MRKHLSTGLADTGCPCLVLVRGRGMGVGRNGVQKFSCPPNVGHSEKCRPPKVGHHFGRSAARHPPRPPGRGAFAAAVRAGDRAPSREFGGRLAPVVNGSSPELSGRVRNRPATITFRPVFRAERRPRPPGPIYFSDPVVAADEMGSGGRGRRSARKTGRQVIVAGLLRTRPDNSGEDPMTTGAKRPPNSRDGAR